jgi:hypothetical protein
LNNFGRRLGHRQAFNCWIATGGLAMRTTILAYVIAIVGLALIVAGARDIYLLHIEETFELL